MPQRRYVLTQQYPADRCPTQPEGDADFCTYKAELIGLVGTDFAIEKLELKATLRVVVNDRLCMTCGGFFTLFAFLCFLTFALTNNSQ